MEIFRISLIVYVLIIRISAVTIIETEDAVIDNRNNDTKSRTMQNITSRQLGHNHVAFEGEVITEKNKRQNGFIKFEDQYSDVQQADNLVAFENNAIYNPGTDDNKLVFEDQPQYQNDESRYPQEETPQPVRKKRRRRRKPKRQNNPGQYGLIPGAQQFNPGQDYGNFGGVGPIAPGVRPIGQGVGPNRPGFGPIGPGVGPGPIGSNGFPTGMYKPYRRRRKPANLAEDALTSVTRALGSIAQYDDFQCVPRLLCEVAGGSNPGGTPSQTTSIIPSFIDLQPLITLLAAFNGLSSSPLFVFGRAVFLGVTSKGNTGTCRYAYPQCPTDPDKLVDYLNNHNGGFFRFFNGGPQLPQNYGPQGLQQFYSQLSNIPGTLNPYPQPQNFGPNPYAEQGYGQQNYGLYNPQNNYQQPQNYDPVQHNYGLYNPVPQSFPHPNQDYPNPNQYQGNYGSRYPYQNGYNKNANVENIDSNKIENRIQNNPEVYYVNTNKAPVNKLKFPTSFTTNDDQSIRVTKSLRFPEENTKINNYISYDEHVRAGKGFSFPETQSNRQYIDYYNYPPYTPIAVNFNSDKLKLDEEGYYVDSDMFRNDGQNNGDGLETIYVLRGNGDPNNPEVIKLRPGQKVI